MLRRIMKRSIKIDYHYYNDRFLLKAINKKFNLKKH